MLRSCREARDRPFRYRIRGAVCPLAMVLVTLGFTTQATAQNVRPFKLLGQGT